MPIIRVAVCTITPDAMRKHIDELAKAFNVRVVHHEGAPDEAAALNLGEFLGAMLFGHERSSDRKAVEQELDYDIAFSRPVTDETSYAVVLHELGHRIHPNGHLPQEHKAARHDQERHLAIQMLEEDNAWDWAMNHALQWSDLMDTVRRNTIATYQAGSERYHAAKAIRERRGRRSAAKLSSMLNRAATRLE